VGERGDIKNKRFIFVDHLGYPSNDVGGAFFD
jgi:hypothetical protein